MKDYAWLADKQFELLSMYPKILFSIEVEKDKEISLAGLEILHDTALIVQLV
jgi:hypothetical protein